MPSINNSCVICDDVRHEKSGKSILIGTYNDVIVCKKADWDGQDSKMALAQIYFANFISGAPSGPLEIVWWIEDPDGDLFGMNEKKEAMTDSSESTRTIFIRITPAIFDKLGTYRFHLETKDFKYDKEFEVRTAESITE